MVNTINNSSGLNLTYEWNFGNNVTNSIFEPSTTYTELGGYTIELVVTDENGCTDTSSVIIDANGEYSVSIPNVFSPNGDGQNDIFYLTLENAVELDATIFNRWGQLIHEWEGLEGGWDGYTKSGLLASEGTYFYLFIVTDFLGEVHEYQGHFGLIQN